jgi:hypothetical protein
MTPSYKGVNELKLCPASLVAIVEEWLRKSPTVVTAPQMEGVKVGFLRIEDDCAVFGLRGPDLL